MTSNFLPRWIRDRVEFVSEEPGTLLVVLVVASWLLFFPGGACGIDEAAMPHPPEAHGSGEEEAH